MSTMTNTQFQFLSDLVRKESAIVLEPGKEYLVESRLSPIARREGLSSVGDLVQRLSSTSAHGLRAQVVDAMTTNETSFYRDIHPWQTLKRDILPSLFAARASSKRLSIWCAACSSGQEPYSLAMMLKDEFADKCATWNISIAATDISESMVQRCRDGLFSQLEVNRGLPATGLMRHFQREGAEWRIDAGIRKMLDARPANLVVPSSMPAMGGIDLVMIRNVLIYFDDATKTQILGDVRSRMKADGYLMLGSSEVTTGAAAGFRREQVDKTIFFRPG
jgi:chemotaxis protein methyltransferase CheR